jgi:hypothetical protein
VIFQIWKNGTKEYSLELSILNKSILKETERLLLSCPLPDGLGREQLPPQSKDIKKSRSFGERLLKNGIDLLSHPQKGSTISANGLNFSVRNGKRWTSLL